MGRPTESQASTANRRAGSWPGSSASRLARRLLMCALAGLIPCAPGLAQGQHMVFNVSSYHDVWASADFSTVYGSSSFIDNSSGCGHSGYATSAFIVTPDSRRFSAGGYLSGYPSGPTNAVVGTYTEVATVQFHCSCVGTVGSGGSDQVCLAHLDGQHRCPTAGEPLACPKRTQGSDARVSDGSTGKPAEPRRDEPRSMVVEVSSVLTVSLPSGGTGGRALTQAGQLEPREQGRPQ